MMKYYHYWMTCPHCHNPHGDQNQLKTSIKRRPDGTALCKYCNCLFTPEVEFQFNGNSRALPLHWEIVPNPIERSYMDWMKSSPHGSFIIIWPWEDVRFSSLLVHEYLKYDDSSRPILVFSPNVVADADPAYEYCMQSPSPNALWKCLCELDVRSTEELKGPQQKTIYKNVEGISRSHRLRELKYRMATSSCTIYADVSRKDATDIIPPGAYLISDQVVPKKQEIFYTKGWFVQVADALETLKQPPSSFDSVAKCHVVTRFQDLENISQEDRIFFIRTSSRSLDAIAPSPNLIKNSICNPRLVIIEDLESLLHSFKREDFISFLTQLPSDCLVLMFSVNRRLRYLHDELKKEIPSVTTHCWETPRRIDSLRMMTNLETRFPSPGSSKSSSLTSLKRKNELQLELTDVDALTQVFNEIDESISKALELGADKWHVREVARYLSHVRRTVLPLNTRFHGFSRWSWFKQDSISFYAFMRELLADEDAIVEKVRKLGSMCEEEHPSMVILLSVLQRIGTERTIIIVHPEDVTKLRNHLVNAIGKECVVVDWTHFSRQIRHANGMHNLIIIDPPYDGDLLNLEKIGRTIIIGDAENNLKVKKIIDSMLGSEMEPSFLRENGSAPQLLISLEEKMKNVETEAIVPELPEVEIITTKVDWSGILRENEPSAIGAGSVGDKQVLEKVIMFSNRDGYSVAFPLHSHLFWKGATKSDTNTALEMYDKKIKECSILLSRHEQPLKVRLADWLINEASSNSHRVGKFIWPSYEEMILDSIEWVERLKQKASIMDEDELARRIRKAGTTAQDEDYIKRWWNVSETPSVITSRGLISIPSIEHPAKLRDLEIIAEVIEDEQLKQLSERIYRAALEIQRIRCLVVDWARESTIVDKPNPDVEPELEMLLTEFKKDFDFFEVNNIQLVPYEESMQLYKVRKRMSPA